MNAATHEAEIEWRSNGSQRKLGNKRDSVSQPSDSRKSLGQIAFEAYQSAIGSEAAWGLMSDKCQYAWTCAAQEVAIAIEDAPTAPAFAPNPRSADVV